eukprot:46941-Prymnesium_polylepis.1
METTHRMSLTSEFEVIAHEEEEDGQSHEHQRHDPIPQGRFVCECEHEREAGEKPKLGRFLQRNANP